MTRFAIVGLGEVGSHFARDLRKGGAQRILGYDIAPAQRVRAEKAGDVETFDTARDAAADADVVFVSVTAGSVLEAMASLCGGLGHRPFVVDVNSVSPSTKREAADVVGRAGGRYVEAAVMTAVPPHGLRSPMLLGGPHASDWAASMAPFEMRLVVFDEEIGRASSVKMCRSVMVKGLEALATECLLAARHYGVEQEVLRSLADTIPHPDWPAHARYLIGRTLVHGGRRAEEMREVARTVADAGIAPLVSAAVAERQRWAGTQGRHLGAARCSEMDLVDLLNSLLAVFRPPGRDACPPMHDGADTTPDNAQLEEEPT